MIDSLQVDSYKMAIPSQWIQLYAGEWCQEINEQNEITEATILIGTDLALLFPINVLNTSALPVQPTSAILMKSRITQKFLAFGYNRKNITQHNLNDV